MKTTIKSLRLKIIKSTIVAMMILFSSGLFAQGNKQYKTLTEKPKLILKTDFGGLQSEEASIAWLGAEYMIGEKFSMESSLGYIVDGNYTYKDYWNQASLNSDALNFGISTGVKYYFRESKAKNSWFITATLAYTNANCKGTHHVCNEWEHYNVFLSSGWNCVDGHENEFTLNVKTMNVIMNAGWQKIFFNRVSFEISTGIVCRGIIEDSKNYEAGINQPTTGYSFFGISYNTSPAESYSPSPITMQAGLKIGYLIY